MKPLNHKDLCNREAYNEDTVPSLRISVKYFIRWVLRKRFMLGTIGRRATERTYRSGTSRTLSVPPHDAFSPSVALQFQE